MAIIYTSRNLPGSYGDYTNGNWGGFMNSYAVRFTPGRGGQGGGAFEGSTFYFSVNVYFPNTGTYAITAAADNSGTLNVGGRGCSVYGFNGSSTSYHYFNRGTYTVSGSVYNAPNGPSYATNPYGIAFTIDAPPPPSPPSISLSASSSTIIRGNCISLSWSASGVGLYSASLTDVSGPGYGGSTTVCPNNTKTYYYTVCGEGGCSTVQRTVTVYIPPVITLSLNRSSIISGECANLSWNTTGDGDKIYWTSGNISNGNVTSSQQVCPEDTTIYCAYVTGLGGTSPISCATLTVYQQPVIQEFEVPVSLTYGQQGFITYKVDYANISVTLEKIYNYNTVSTSQGTQNLNKSGTAELSGPNPRAEGTVNTDITYNNFGPRSVTYILSISGSGGQIIQSKTIQVNIDELPDNVVLEETDNLFKDQEPVYTPDIVPEETVTTDLYLIDGVDIPVEIKSNYPLKVSLNNNNNWVNLREIGSPPPAGSSVSSQYGLTLKSDNFTGDELLIPETQALNVAYERLVTCISLIDEASPPVSSHQGDWSAFRNNYPYRNFYLLQPAINSNGSISYPTSELNMPPNYLSDPYANGAVQVRRDNGNANFTSDWFSICGLSQVPEGAYVSLWIDISGSMVFNTIQASYNLFVQRCQSAGVQIVLETSDSGERWIPGHNKDLPPSANFKIIDRNGNEVTTVRIASGECVTLSWIIFGEVTSANINPVIGDISNQPGGYQYVDTQVVCPTSDTMYQLTATGPAGSTFKTVFVDVLTRPSIIFSANPGTSITAGSCVTINWETTGDADQIVWTSGNITNGNLTSSQNVCPQETTTYCAYATGEAGPSPISCITITVAQQPTASISSPLNINYGDDIFVSFTTQYADVSITITPVFTYIDNSTTTGTPISITPVAESAEIGGVNTVVSNDNFQVPISWNQNGPKSIQFILSVQGSGGSKTAISNTNVIIDRTPDNISIDETDDAFKDQDPVYAPDIVPEEVIVSDLYLIDSIDIPVEIKSNYPIKVDINNSKNWKDLRQI